jgi:hypothetical protein
MRSDYDARQRQLTIAEWNAMGRRISKGAKMCGRNESGAPLFHEWSTYRPSSSGRRYRSHGGDWDSDPGYSDLGIETFQ